MMKWIDITKQKPPQKNYYIVCWDYYGLVGCGEARWEDGEWIYPSWGEGKDVINDKPKVLFWTEFPKPPV